MREHLDFHKSTIRLHRRWQVTLTLYTRCIILPKTVSGLRNYPVGKTIGQILGQTRQNVMSRCGYNAQAHSKTSILRYIRAAKELIPSSRDCGLWDYGNQYRSLVAYLHAEGPSLCVAWGQFFASPRIPSALAACCRSGRFQTTRLPYSRKEPHWCWPVSRIAEPVCMFAPEVEYSRLATPYKAPRNTQFAEIAFIAIICMNNHLIARVCVAPQYTRLKQAWFKIRRKGG